MRLLHTGDWHLGRRLYGVDRRDEQRRALAEVAAVAGRERVDAILVAGDLLERRLIEPEPLSDCLDALDGLARVAPVIAVIGNHDDPALWDRLAPYLAPAGVHVVARARTPEDATLTVETGSGPLHVACLPWLETERLPVALGTGATEVRGTYADRAAGVVRAYADAARARRAEDGGVAVLLAHLMVDRARAGGGEREMTIGVTFAVAGDTLPIDLDYIALGHVHRPQAVPGLAAPGRYAGAPVLHDFADEGVTPSVAIASIGEGEHAVTEVALETPRRLVRLRGALADLSAAARAHEEALFFLEVELDAAEPDLADRVRELVPGALRVEPRYPQTDTAEPAEVERKAVSITDLYRDWRTAIEAPADAAVVEALEAALSRAESAAAPDREG